MSYAVAAYVLAVALAAWLYELIQEAEE